MSKKVLFVEDSKSQQDYWRRKLPGKVVFIGALSIREAEELFADNFDIEAIVMDACVPGDSVNTLQLVRKFRDTFTGPMIATSSVPWYRDALVQAGCDHESEKDSLPQKLLEVLSL